MNEYAEKANWVLSSRGINEIPAGSLGEIAESESIRYLHRRMEDVPELDGILIYRGSKVGLIINTIKDNIGRQNFTFAHELGHYFLKHQPSFNGNGESGFRCNIAEVESDRREIEANKFVVELLMPEKMFRPLLAGAVLDFILIRSLTQRFMVSKNACCNRILEFISGCYIVIFSKGLAIHYHKSSQSAAGLIKRLSTIPPESSAYKCISEKRGQNEFAETKAHYWLSSANPGNKIYEWTRGDFQNGVAMTILTW